MQILPIASGKGGVGKSLLAANLAIALAQAGRRTVLADLDLGGSNLHLVLGLRALPAGIGTWMKTPSVPFSSLLVPTEVENLSFIPGDSEIPGMANLKPQQKRALIKNLLTLEADFLVLDLGAGTGVNTVDFFLMSNHGIVITTPTLTATLNAYFFLKNALIRLLDTHLKKGTRAYDLWRKAGEGTGLQKLYLPSLLDRIRQEDPASYESYQAKVGQFQPRLVFNMLEDPKDADKAAKVRRSTREYLGIDLEHLGIIYRDNLQDVALSSRLPILIYKPQSLLSQAVQRIAEKLLSYDRDETGPLDLETLDETHDQAENEAETDFDAKLTGLGELMDTGALTMGDLVETVRHQQFEINQLRKENNLLKSKIVKALQQGVRL